jgi:hypothetical protein
LSPAGAAGIVALPRTTRSQRGDRRHACRPDRYDAHRRRADRRRRLLARRLYDDPDRRGNHSLANFQAFYASPEADGACQAPPEFGDLRAKALADSDEAFRAALANDSRSSRDSRVPAVAPALGPAFLPESLERIDIEARGAALPTLCIDAPGVDRDAIHAKTAGLAEAFFAGHLRQ